MRPEVTPAGVVLAGGASRRMGTDKAFVDVDGRPMVVRVAGALRDAGCRPVECQGGDRRRLTALGLEVVPDERPGAGPLAAIEQALRRHPLVVVAACDLPWLDAATVRRLVAAVRNGAVASAAHAAGRRHLVTCWSDPARDEVTAAVGAGRPSVMSLLASIGAVDVEVDPDTVHNVNRPGDLGRRR